MGERGKLYIVPTPVGNLEDMTYRGVRILKEAELILAEDTRISKRLLNHYGISNKLASHHKFNEHATVKTIAAKIEAGITVALISDAGTPGISDPGFLLIRTCIQNGIDVETLPGATAFIPALVNSGFPTDRFLFEGFLPQKKGRMKRLEALKEEPRTILLYESPFRVVKLLQQLEALMGPDRLCSVSRELTKMFEETVRGTLNELIAHFQENPPRGEFVVVVMGKTKENQDPKSEWPLENDQDDI